MICAGVARIPRSPVKGRAHLRSIPPAKLFPEKTFGLILSLRKLQQPRRIRERDRLHILKVFAGRVCIAASTSVERSWESSRRMEQFHDRNQPDPAKQVARDLFEEVLAGIVDVWNSVFSAMISVPRLRSIPHRPKLVANLWQANYLDADPSL
jgi:hypothetical protein